MSKIKHVVTGSCPSCGRSKVVLIDGNLQCDNPGCKEPDAVSRLLNDQEIHHTIVLEETGFILRHPLLERVDERLMNCKVHATIANMTEAPAPPGAYRLHIDLEEGWLWEPLPGTEDA